MKVLVIHTAYKLRGGEDTVVQNEIELLMSAGHKIELLQFSNSGGTLFKLLQLPFNLSSYNATKQKIKDFKPDIIHIHNLHFAASPSVVYAAKKQRVPVVITLHNYRLLCPSATLFEEDALYTKSINCVFPWDAVVKAVYHKSRLLTFWLSCSMWLHQWLGTWKWPVKYIALGDYTKEIFAQSKLAFILPHIAIKPNFCYADEAIQNRTGDYYLFVGRLSEEKGLRVLIDAFSQNNLPLKIAGTGPMEKELRARAAAFTNITFLGSLNKKGIENLLANAKALIFPSIWYETFGMVVIEAFAMGIPVIASKLGQMAITITDRLNGLYFEAGNSTDLLQKLTLFESLSSTELEVYKINARKTYDQLYTPEKNLKILEQLYQDAVNSSF